MKGNLLAGVTLGVILLFFITIPIFSAEKKSSEDEFKALRDDIQICNLLNGLYLSEEQIEKITPLAKRAGKLREEFKVQKETFARESIDILATMKREILEKGDAYLETKKRHNSMRDAFESVEYKHKEDMKKLNSEVQRILDENQKIIVAEYKPCLIPIKGIFNSERIGLAGENDAIIKILSRVRKISEDKYLKTRDHFIDRITPRLMNHFSEEEIPAQIENIKQVINEARSMSDEEFELEKSYLASRIKPVKNENTKMALIQKIDKFLLNPRFVDMANEKIKIEKKAASSSKNEL